MKTQIKWKTFYGLYSNNNYLSFHNLGRGTLFLELSFYTWIEREWLHLFWHADVRFLLIYDVTYKEGIFLTLLKFVVSTYLSFITQLQSHYETLQNSNIGIVHLPYSYVSVKECNRGIFEERPQPLLSYTLSWKRPKMFYFHIFLCCHSFSWSLGFIFDPSSLSASMSLHG